MLAFYSLHSAARSDSQGIGIPSSSVVLSVNVLVQNCPTCPRLQPSCRSHTIPGMVASAAFPTGEFPLHIGQTFQDPFSGPSYHSIRYDFKPASVNTEAPGSLRFGADGQVSFRCRCFSRAQSARVSDRQICCRLPWTCSRRAEPTLAWHSLDIQNHMKTGLIVSQSLMAHRGPCSY